MFYGWRVVAVTFVTNFIAVGLVFYSDIAFQSSRATHAAMPGS